MVHALTPYEVTGVENHTAQLAAALVRAGLEVQVFSPAPAVGTWRLAERLEERDGYEIHWLALGDRQPDEEGNEPGVAQAFGRYLDRERPHVVHAQHLVGLGPALVAEARRRGIPFVFTAHDAWLVSEEYRLLRPDFVALLPGDAEAMGRVLLARRLLDRLLPDADHQGLVLAGELDESERVLLAAVLDGDPGEAGFESREISGMSARAAAGQRARLAALEGVDVVISPTEFLKGVLRSGGVEGAIVVEPCGIDLAPFRHRAPRVRGKEAALRMVFLGGISKHKGLHDVLEAVDGLLGVEFAVHGGSSDRAYEERCRARAMEVGAEWCGAFEVAELPVILASTDVVVVPSKWPENAPFVIREAFAAGVPVIAADVGAMRESVRDGVDGWLYPAGDVVALRERIVELAESRELVEEVAQGVVAPGSVDAQAAGLVERYRGLVESESESELEAGAGSGRPRARLEHLEDFTRRYEALADQGWRELVAGTLAGYGRLCEALAPGRAAGERIVDAVAKGTRLRERMAEGERARVWLARVVDETRRSGAVSEERAEWQAQTEGALAEEVAWLQEQLAARDAEVAALSEERDVERLASERLASERDAVAADLELAGAGGRWLQGQLESSRGEARRLEAERDARARDLAERTREAEWQQGELSERDQRLAHGARKLEDARRALTAAQAELADVRRARVASEAAREHEEAVGELAREESSWRRAVGEARERELAEEREKVAGLSEAREQLVKEVSWLRETHAALREEIAFLRADVSAREEERGRWRQQIESLSGQQERLLEHELWLRAELRRLLDAVSGVVDGGPGAQESAMDRGAREELAPEDVAERVSAAVDAMLDGPRAARGEAGEQGASDGSHEEGA